MLYAADTKTNDTIVIAGFDVLTYRISKPDVIGGRRVVPSGRPSRRRWAWLCLVLVFLARGTLAQTPDPRTLAPAADQEPITPIPPPPDADPLKVALGKHLFEDRRLSHDGTTACSSCHDVHTNGAGDGRRAAPNGSKLSFNTLTVFNAALSFRLNWEGNFRTLESQAASSLETPEHMGSNIDEVLRKLDADPKVVGEFANAYGRPPDRTGLLDAIATYERSLLTPGSRFDRWLGGDTAALAPEELNGYQLFKSLGCVSCHQGVNVGGNLFERHGIFHPLAAPKPELLRVPGLRNVATRAAYFHDGSAPTLVDAVRRMAAAQLDRVLSDQQIAAIVAFLNTLTGTYRGAPVAAPPP
jgi:cytochrome c peroxidase